MADLSTQQLAELLAGIARAQAAVVQAMESAMPGARAQYVTPALQIAARLREQPAGTLTDLPARVLLAYMGRVSPDVNTIAADLERLLGAGPVAPASGAAPAPQGDGSGSLDFSAPG